MDSGRSRRLWRARLLLVRPAAGDRLDDARVFDDRRTLPPPSSRFQTSCALRPVKKPWKAYPSSLLCIPPGARGRLPHGGRVGRGSVTSLVHMATRPSVKPATTRSPRRENVSALAPCIRGDPMVRLRASCQFSPSVAIVGPNEVRSTAMPRPRADRRGARTRVIDSMDIRAATLSLGVRSGNSGSRPLIDRLS